MVPYVRVNKTTVYLPDDLKKAVERLAASQGRSEAAVIRDAIASVAQAERRPRPRGGLFASGDATLSENVDNALAGFGDS